MLEEEMSEQEQQQKPEQEQEQAKPQVPEEIRRRLTELEAETARASVMSELMQDPVLREVLEARQTGRNIRIVDAAQEPVPQLPENLDEATPTVAVKAVSEHLTKYVNDVIGKRIASLEEQLSKVNEVLKSQTAEKVNREVEEARRKYKDFDAHLPTIIELNRKVSGLNLDDLYSLAVIKKAGGVDKLRIPARPETEKPNTSVTKPSVGKSQEVKPGHAGFSELLDAALSRIKIDFEGV